jgi:2-polyprenyl-3-methyl-5-hydroxy-6-metoxy-1,4-benzoquinol methylase
MSHVEQLSEAIPVSMADDWFEIADENHFWMQWRFAVFNNRFNTYLPTAARLLEVGCGSGTFRDQAERYTQHVVDGCDLNAYALNLSKQAKGRTMVYNIFDAREELLNAYGGVMMMDVIEHIDDDVAFLKAAAAHVVPNGYVIVNVPAHMALFSQYDEVAGHKRRYSKHTLAQSFQKAGITPIEMRYWGASMIPIAIARKIYLNFVSKEKTIEKGFAPPGAAIHAFLKFQKNFELALPLSFPFGTSLMAIGRRS